MPPSGLAILLGAGPVTGAGIARILSSPEHGNLAVALLARRPDALTSLAEGLRKQNSGAVIESFPTDISSPEKLEKTFEEIKKCQAFKGLGLKLAIFNVKHSSKKPFMNETYEDFTDSINSYVGGAFKFAQLSLARFFSDHGSSTLAEGSPKKGTLIFTGTLGALRCNAEFASYGAGRSSVRQLAQALAREMSAKGVHVVHSIANGSIVDEDSELTKQGKKIQAEAVGKTYLWLSQQEPTLWCHELDLRPAQEKF